MFAQLGDIVFEALFGPDSYDDVRETEYARVPLINRKPRLQRTGEKLDEINLSISFKSAFCIPEVEYRRLNEKRVNGEILTFAWGTGDVEGDFVIGPMKRMVNATAPDGNHRDVTLQLQLIEYYNPDKLGAMRQTAKRNAFATTLDAPTPENIQVSEPSPATDVMKDVSGADVSTGQINSTLNSAANKAGGYNDAIDKAQVFLSKVKAETYQLKKLVRGTKQLLSSIGVKLGANPTMAALVPTLSAEVTAADTSVTAAETVVNGFGALPDPVSSLSDANQIITAMNDTVQATANMKTANDRVKKAAQPLAIAIATRKEF